MTKKKPISKIVTLEDFTIAIDITSIDSLIEQLLAAKKMIEDLGGTNPYLEYDTSSYYETTFRVNYTRPETPDEVKARLLAEEKLKARKKKYEEKRREEKIKKDLVVLKRLAKKYPATAKEVIGE